jgi:putative ABC transport system permease protein
VEKPPSPMTGTSLAARNLFRRPVRTALSILGVGVSIGALIAFVSLARGFRVQFTRLITSTGAELVVQQRGSMGPEHSRLSDKDLAALRAIPGVVEASASTFTVVLHGTMPMPVVGREPGSRLLRKYRILEGTGLTEKDDELVVGRQLAQQQGMKVGDAVELRDRTYRVVGRFEVIEPIPMENNCALATIRAVKDLMPGDGGVHLAFLYLEDPRRTDAVLGAIAKALPGLEVSRASEYVEKGFREQLDYAEYFAWAVSSLALAVAAIVILLVMLTNVNERTREIGTLRALGWSRRAVIALVLREGILLCLMGALAGAALGVGGAELLALKWPHGLFVPDFGAGLFLQALAVAVGIGVAGALYPAWRATGMTPVEALRYE